MMAKSEAAFPYETRLNVLHPPLEVIDEKALADGCEFRWYNQTLCRVNGSVVRLGVIEGEYHWHQHTDEDEFFYVVEGELLIDLEDRVVSLKPRPGVRRTQENDAPHASPAANRHPDGRERGNCSDRRLKGRLPQILLVTVSGWVGIGAG